MKVQEKNIKIQNQFTHVFQVEQKKKETSFIFKNLNIKFFFNH